MKYQALADIKATLAKHDRATVVMACGTGKTLVSLWAAEQETPKTVLVLVPSLTLLKQTLLEWSEQTSWGERFSYVCVCSDPTVNLKDDALNTDTSEVGFRVDTDPTIVRRFLERQTTDIKVIFSTYQSAHVVGAGANGLPPIDLAIFDEAHKTIRGASSYAISDENIKIRKRLFFTATPRHVDIHHRDKEGEFRFYSMDDEAIYGPRAHTLSFGTAANKGIICRYKVIIAIINKQMVDDFTRKQGITLVEQDEISARWMANLIAAQKAIEEVDAKKIISFHSRVQLAQEFASKEPRGIAYHLPGYDVRHVNGEQSSGDRAEIIRAFSDADKSLLTNARCLTEGINIPSVDMVAFIDPRQSRIDITQAVGRAMRKPRGPTTKTVGYVVVPVFAGMSDEDSLEGAIKSENFESVVDVLNALQEHDEELVDIIRELKERKGLGEPFNPRRFSEKIEVIGPRVDLDLLTTSICVEIVGRIGSSWDEWFGLVQRFRNREGHCRVPAKHKEGEYRLGGWVATQRQNRLNMPTDRQQRLDELGFVWDPQEISWEEGFSCLKIYKEREGHCRIPAKHKEGGYQLGRWLDNQRTTEAQLSAKRRQRLDELGVDWDPFELDWEQGFSQLKVYRNREGHCRVPAKHKEGEYRLGGWVDTQRQNRLKIPVERRQRLDGLGFVWEVLIDQWETSFRYLKRYKEREGHCRIPRGHKENGFRLGGWVLKLRHKLETMPIERRQRLDELGFVWDPFESDWEQGFSYLKMYKDREGHCRVPFKHKEGEYRLGGWVDRQRQYRAAIPIERRQRLDELGFVWDPFKSDWEQGFSYLKMYKDREGHCRVPFKHKEGEYRLGGWVDTQRQNRQTMPADRQQRLDELGFVWRAKT